jgi:threonine synthase
MGLPVEQLVIATNRNDVLHRVMTESNYSRQELHHTLSPSMDISVSSNFERLLFDLYDRDGAAITTLMDDFESGSIELSADAMSRARGLFSSQRVDDEQTCAEISQTFSECEYVLDPHTAIGVRAAREQHRTAATPMITMATAHPAKFPEAVINSGDIPEPGLPLHMQDLFEREERYSVLDNDLAAVHQHMASLL